MTVWDPVNFDRVVNFDRIPVIFDRGGGGGSICTAYWLFPQLDNFNF